METSKLSTMPSAKLESLIETRRENLGKANTLACFAGNLAHVFNSEMQSVADGAPVIRGMEMTTWHQTIARQYMAAFDALREAMAEKNARLDHGGSLKPIRATV